MNQENNDNEDFADVSLDRSSRNTAKSSSNKVARKRPMNKKSSVVQANFYKSINIKQMNNLLLN